MSYPVKFGKYLLLERVNVGGMAEVFKAKTFGVAGFERIIAIKRILPTLVEDEDFIRMFIDEARIAVQLNHANIIQIYELGKHGEHYYIAMEYLASKDLRAILDRQRMNAQLMPIPQAAYIVSKICEGLDYAHRRRDPTGQPMNIVHRDVSPQNILISYEGEVKVIDFGIAKAANRASKTEAGVLKGKFGYMSPEQVRGLPIDRRSDIFAVGVLLYEMVTGERLFIGESDFSTLERVRNAEVAPPTTFNKKISPELEQIIMRSLAREVEDRYTYASEFAEDLQRFLIEERSIYSAKKLAAYMKEAYSGDIAKERAKMEQFLQGDDINVDFDDATVQGRSGKMPPTPPPAHSLEGGPVGASDKTALRPTTDEESEEYDFEDGADKTFVIEASEAGVALTATPSETGGLSDTGNDDDYNATNDDFLNGPSLYGDEADYEDDDDAKTQISFNNPFDEGHNADDDMMSDPDEATQLRPPDDATLPPLPNVPPPSVAPSIPPASALPSPPTTGPGAAPFDPVAAAMAEDGSALPPPVAAEPSGPQVPVGAPADASMDMAPPPPTAEPPTSETAGIEAPAKKKKKKKKKKISTGMAVAIVGGLFLSFSLVAAVGIGLFIKLRNNGGASQMADAHWQLTAAPGTPTDVKVLLDGNEVATALPTKLDVKAMVAHQLKVTADGHTDFDMALPPMAGGATGPLTISLVKAAGAEASAGAQVAKVDDGKTAGDKADNTKAAAPPVDESKGDGKDASKVDDDKGDGKGGDDEGKTANGAAQADGAPKEDGANEAGDAAEGDNKAVAAAPSEGAGGPRPQNLPDNMWRISFATIAKGGPLVSGAEVYLNGKLVGQTPFEGEFPTSTETLALQVKANGFADKSISVSHNGRAVVGPATLVLAKPGEEDPPAEPADGTAASNGDENGSGEGAKVAVAGGATKDGAAPDDGAKAEPAKAEPTKTEPAKAEPAKAEPAKAEPKSEPTKVAKAQPKPKPKPKAKRKPKKKAAGNITHLAVGSRPSAQVWVDRVKQKRNTPLMGNFRLKLKPGVHWVSLKSVRDGQNVKVKVNVGADSPKNKLILSFGGGPIAKGNVKILKVVK